MYSTKILTTKSSHISATLHSRLFLGCDSGGLVIRNAGVFWRQVTVYGWLQTWDTTRNSRVPTKATNTVTLYIWVDILSRTTRTTPGEIPTVKVYLSTSPSSWYGGSKQSFAYIWDETAAKSFLDTIPTKIRN